jgi:hypothetical protein
MKLKLVEDVSTYRQHIKQSVVTKYGVVDEFGQRVAFITNTQANDLPAKWTISDVREGIRWRPEASYPTAEDALAALSA